jgi:hypothetical protein
VFPLRRERTQPSAVTDSTKRRLPSRQPRWVRALGRSACAEHPRWSRNETVRGSPTTWRVRATNATAARVPQRGAGPTTRRGSPQRAADPTTRRKYVTNAASRGPPTCRGLSRKRGEARVSRHAGGVYPHMPRAAAARTRAGPIPQCPWAPDPATPRAAVLTQRDAGPCNAPARAPTTRRWACPEHFRARTTRVPRPAIKLRAARSFSARTHTPR